jgi:CDP-diacylglycerol--serine O-phosphatidyltransferase
MESYDVARADVPLLAWGLTLFAGITMVSSVRFYSGKDINLRKSVPFRMVVMIALSVVALMQVANNLPEVLFSLFAIYAASGYAMWAWRRFPKKPVSPSSGP